MDDNIREANEIIEDLSLADLNEEFVEELRDSLVSFLDDGILLDAHADDNEEVIDVHLIHEMGLYRVEYQKDDGSWFTHFIDRNMCEHAVNVWTTGVPEEGDTMVDNVQMSIGQNPESPDSVLVSFSKGDAAEDRVIDQYEFNISEVYPMMKEFVERVEQMPDSSLRARYHMLPVENVNLEEQYLQ